jgi:cytosine/creatinine deaminase
VLYRGKDNAAEVGCDASFVLLRARDAVEAIRLRANPSKVWRKRKLPAETAEVKTKLNLLERPEKVNFVRR